MSKIYSVTMLMALSIFSVLLVPNTSFAQIIYSENFDGASSLPNGWTTNSTSWTMDSSNFSTGYTGASGLWNVQIQNSSPAGYDSLITKSISTVGYNNVTVIWAARNTNHFSDSGSSIHGFYWSTDQGSTWNNLAYTENGNNSTWSIDNGGATIALPAGASNAASLQFCWVAHIVTAPSGTYRIDDFKVAGSPTTGITEAVSAETLADVYLSDRSTLSIALKQNTDEKVFVELYDIAGKAINKLEMNSSSAAIDVAGLSKGLYFVKLNTTSCSAVTRIVIE